MLRNYLKIAYRNLRRRPGYALINVFGLAAGLATCILIGLYIQEELAFDRFHADADRLYRVVTFVNPPDGDPRGVTTNGWPVGRTIRAEYPEVEALTYLYGNWQPAIEHEGRYYHDDILAADSAFFDLFGFPLVAGDPRTALEQPYSLVLTQGMAEKYFGRTDVLGETLTLDDSLTFTITGVARVPPASHITFDALISLSTRRVMQPGFDDSDQWFTLQAHNYLRLREGAEPEGFAEKLATLYDRHFGEWNSYTLEARIEPMLDVYLRSDLGNGLGPKSDIRYVYLLSAIALFVLAIAAINFMNLATARATERAKEVGIRKVIGSTRPALVRQFLTDSVLTTGLALVLSLGLVTLTLPYFNSLTGKSFGLSELATPSVGALLLGLMLLVGLGAGLYPAFVLSRHRPVEVIKGTFATGQRGARLRQGLVMFQFALSCGLIICTLVVLSQLRYMQAQDLGFAEEQVLVVDASDAPGRARFRQSDAIKQALAQHAGVRFVSAAGALPGRSGWRGQVTFPQGRESKGASLEHVMADADYVEVLGLALAAGRDVEAERAADDEEVALINEAAARVFGWTPEEAIGRWVVSPGSRVDAKVVGVLEDYHQHGLQEPIPPMLVTQQNPWARHFFVLRVDPHQVAGVLDYAADCWTSFFPGYDFSAFFLSEEFAEQYAQERRLARIFTTFAALAIVIACLGLFGLAAYATAQRTKEIGVRKVLGASVASIVALLSKDFLKLVGLAVVIAAPLAYFAMQRWLEGFAYRIEVGPGIFLFTGGVVLLIALVTVSYQAIKAALTDPVKSLRYE